MKSIIAAVSLISLILFSGLLLSNKAQHVPETHTTATPVYSPLKTVKAEVPLNTTPISSLDLKGSSVLTIYGEINDSVTEVANEITRLSQTESVIYLLIDSGGGSVMAGAKVVAAIQASKAKVVTVCMADCLSMGFIIHQYGHERYMTPNAVLMSHPAFGGIQGTLAQIEARLTMITRYVNRFDGFIANRAGISVEQFQNMSESELWLDAYDSLEQKFADKIVVVGVEESPDVIFFNPPSKSHKKFSLTWK
jgi:ATP-dependent Clp endopeptidase proteolytic subunit ClpP